MTGIPQGFNHKLGEGEGSNMSIDSLGSLQLSNNGGSVDSSSSSSTVASSHDSNAGILLDHQALKRLYSFSQTLGLRTFSHDLSDDELVQALLDPRFELEGLQNFEEWTIDLGKLNMGLPNFAMGSFGKQYKGRYNGLDVAIKLLAKPENNPEVENLLEQQVQQEVMMLATLNHPNIVGFIGACQKPGVWCIINEYAKKGSVRQLLMKRKNRPVPVVVAVKQALDVAKGMEYAHGLGLIHRNLKSNHLLISADNSIKIADFCVARLELQSDGITPDVGFRWMAPEMIQHTPGYTQKVDVYSFGIVLWELITGMVPFGNKNNIQVAFAVVTKGARPTIPGDCLPALSDIMTRCWDADPDLRPSFPEVVTMLDEVVTTLRKNRCKCCMAPPRTID